jgi:hypothetical protein
MASVLIPAVSLPSRAGDCVSHGLEGRVFEDYGADLFGDNGCCVGGDHSTEGVSGEDNWGAGLGFLLEDFDHVVCIIENEVGIRAIGKSVAALIDGKDCPVGA